MDKHTVQVMARLSNLDRRDWSRFMQFSSFGGTRNLCICSSTLGSILQPWRQQREELNGNCTWYKPNLKLGSNGISVVWWSLSMLYVGFVCPLDAVRWVGMRALFWGDQTFDLAHVACVLLVFKKYLNPVFTLVEGRRPNKNGFKRPDCEFSSRHVKEESSGPSTKEVCN